MKATQLLKTNPTGLTRFADLTTKNKKLELYVTTDIQATEYFRIFNVTRSDFFSVLFFLNGELNFEINQQKQTAVKNSILFLRPNTFVNTSFENSNAKVNVVLFTSKFLLQIGMKDHEVNMVEFITGNSGSVLFFDKQEAKSLLKLIKDLKVKNDQVELHPFGEDIVKYAFRIFLYEMTAMGKNYSNSLNQKSSRKHYVVMEFIKFMNSTFKEQRGLKYYADKLSITPKYLSEIVNEITGKSAKGLIDEKVMFEAKQLLDNPKFSINQIAELLNFADQSFMGKYFKRHLGVSPSQYRNHRVQ
ncbi:hypothetical protein CNR22_15900 [Sphingobacteriaceae bacterium]|nr:hypothetical protein CNR22_15900 [Sphingobacteriaceae bacterium]